MRILIVDDEPLARRGLRLELDAIPDVACVGEVSTRDAAVTAIRETKPDVVLLDVQLGRATGFEVIERIGADAMPLVIFVTAYDRHALRAFEVHAIDYVLKPVDPLRLREAVDRAAHQRSLERGASLAERLERLLASRPGDAESSAIAPVVVSNSMTADRIVVSHGERRAFVDVLSIDWVEAYGNYVRVHVGPHVYILRSTLARTAARLGVSEDTRTRFARIRRSALVNVSSIATVEPYGRGMFVVALRDGTKLVSSRYHQNGLRTLLRADR